jgi:hypothetical protein
LSLVGLDINNEDEGVVLLNLLHGALGVQWVDDDLVLVEAGLGVDRLARVLRSTGELKGLRSVEGSRETDLADLVGVNLRHISFDALQMLRTIGKLTPFKAALAAAVAFLLPALAAPIKNLRISNRS